MIEIVDKQKLESAYGIRFEKFNYLIHIDDQRRIVYFETPKVACTSIKKYMMDQYVGGEMHLKHIGAVHDRSISPLKQLETITRDDARAIFQDSYRRFTFSRNPYSRILSAYLDKIVTNEWERERHLPVLGFALDYQPTFLEFLQKVAGIRDHKRDIHYMTQARLTGRLAGLKFNFIGRFESFSTDFAKFKSSFYEDETKNDYHSLGKHHASNASEKLALYYGSQEVMLVRDIYAADFITFGYSLDINNILAAEIIAGIRVP